MDFQSLTLSITDTLACSGSASLLIVITDQDRRMVYHVPVASQEGFVTTRVRNTYPLIKLVPYLSVQVSLIGSPSWED